MNEGDYVIGTSLGEKIDFSHKALTVIELDLSKDQSIVDCAKVVTELGRGIDIHINNAGVLLDDGNLNINIEKLRHTLQINLIGVIDLTQRIIPLMSAGAHIVNISSTAGILSKVYYPDYPVYKISKAALNMFTTYLSTKLQGKIAVSSVHPGRVRTSMGNGEGDMDPEEAAEYIYTTAKTKNIETGQFWFKGEKIPW